MPDIDIDFEDTRRERVIEYVQQNMANIMCQELLPLDIYWQGLLQEM